RQKCNGSVRQLNTRKGVEESCPPRPTACKHSPANSSASLTRPRETATTHSTPYGSNSHNSSPPATSTTTAPTVTSSPPRCASACPRPKHAAPWTQAPPGHTSNHAQTYPTPPARRITSPGSTSPGGPLLSSQAPSSRSRGTTATYTSHVVNWAPYPRPTRSSKVSSTNAPCSPSLAATGLTRASSCSTG